MERVMRADALTKGEFHERLRSWFHNTDDHVIKADVLGPTAWVHVRDGSEIFILHADTPRHAVDRYLRLVSRYGDEMEWQVATSQRGKPTAVVFGPDRIRDTSFYLYRAEKKSGV